MNNSVAHIKTSANFCTFKPLRYIVFGNKAEDNEFSERTV